jgi:hypothetical protein
MSSSRVTVDGFRIISMIALEFVHVVGAAIQDLSREGNVAVF